MRFVFCFGLLLITDWACSFADDTSQPDMYFPPPGESLNVRLRVTPAEIAMTADFIDGLKPLVAGRWALWRNGYLIHVEGDFNTKGDVASLRKTWHALTVGGMRSSKAGSRPSKRRSGSGCRNSREFMPKRRGGT